MRRFNLMPECLFFNYFTMSVFGQVLTHEWLLFKLSLHLPKKDSKCHFESVELSKMLIYGYSIFTSFVLSFAVYFMKECNIAFALACCCFSLFLYLKRTVVIETIKEHLFRVEIHFSVNSHKTRTSLPLICHSHR